jgi:hypothetical protein
MPMEQRWYLIAAPRRWLPPAACLYGGDGSRSSGVGGCNVDSFVGEFWHGMTVDENPSYTSVMADVVGTIWRRYLVEGIVFANHVTLLGFLRRKSYI